MIRLNLLPVRVSKKKAAGKQQLVLFAVLVVGGYVGNFLWARSRAAELSAVQVKLSRTQSEIGQLDRIIGEVKNIREQQSQLKEKLDILAELKTKRSGPVRVMDALASVTPKRLWLTKVEDKGGVLSVAGSAATIDDVSEFMSALKGSQYFRNVELGKTAARADKGHRFVDFNLAAAVVYSPGTAAAAAPQDAKGR
jgi:type IV pilus assembly protein PilN